MSIHNNEMKKASENILPPIRSLRPSNESSLERFATFRDPENRQLPQPCFNRPGPDSLRDYHRRQSHPQNPQDQYRRSSVVYPQARHIPWPSTFGGRGQPCISPSPSCDGQLQEAQNTEPQTSGCITPVSSVEYSSACNHFNQYMSQGIPPGTDHKPWSVPDISSLIHNTNRVRKPYKDSCKRSRGPDTSPDLDATPFLPSPTDVTAENNTLVQPVSSKFASIIKHKQNERTRRSKHDKWIRILDRNLPDRALEAIGVSLDNKKPVSKEQVLEMEVWYSATCRDAIDWLLRRNETLERELAASKSVKAEVDARRDMAMENGIRRGSERCICDCGRVCACLCVTTKPADFSVEYRRAGGDNKMRTFRWGHEKGGSASPERYMVEYEDVS